MIRFHNTPKEDVLAKVRDTVGEPHDHDGQTFLFNAEMPKKSSLKMIELYRLGGYPVHLEYLPQEGLEVKLKHGAVHKREKGKWTKK
jgi:hypothetical protein